MKSNTGIYRTGTISTGDPYEIKSEIPELEDMQGGGRAWQLARETGFPWLMLHGFGISSYPGYGYRISDTVRRI